MKRVIVGLMATMMMFAAGCGSEPARQGEPQQQTAKDEKEPDAADPADESTADEGTEAKTENSIEITKDDFLNAYMDLLEPGTDGKRMLTATMGIEGVMDDTISGVTCELTPVDDKYNQFGDATVMLYVFYNTETELVSIVSLKADDVLFENAGENGTEQDRREGLLFPYATTMAILSISPEDSFDETLYNVVNDTSGNKEDAYIEIGNRLYMFIHDPDELVSTATIVFDYAEDA